MQVVDVRAEGTGSRVEIYGRESLIELFLAWAEGKDEPCPEVLPI